MNIVNPRTEQLFKFWIYLGHIFNVDLKLTDGKKLFIYLGQNSVSEIDGFTTKCILTVSLDHKYKFSRKK